MIRYDKISYHILSYLKLTKINIISRLHQRYDKIFTWEICLDMFELAANAFETLGTRAHWLVLTFEMVMMVMMMVMMVMMMVVVKMMVMVKMMRMVRMKL